MLREELQLLQEQGSYVGEVVKPMGKLKRNAILLSNLLFSYRQEEGSGEGSSRRKVRGRFGQKHLNQ